MKVSLPKVALPGSSSRAKAVTAPEPKDATYRCRPSGDERQAARPGETGDAADEIAFDLEEGQLAARRIAREDRHRVVALAHRVEVLAERGEHERAHRAEAVDAVEPVGNLADELEPAEVVAVLLSLAREDRDRARAPTRHVEMTAVRRDRGAARRQHSSDSADAVLLALEESERAGRRVARERDHRVVGRAGDVDVAAVGRERHPRGAVQAVDAAQVVEHGAEIVELAGAGVAREDGDAVAQAAGRVEVLAQGRDRDRRRRRRGPSPSCGRRSW